MITGLWHKLIAAIVTIAICLCGSIAVHHVFHQSWNLALIYNRTKWMFHDFNPAIETPLMAACMMAAIVVWFMGAKGAVADTRSYRCMC